MYCRSATWYKDLQLAISYWLTETLFGTFQVSYEDCPKTFWMGFLCLCGHFGLHNCLLTVRIVSRVILYSSWGTLDDLLVLLPLARSLCFANCVLLQVILTNPNQIYSCSHTFFNIVLLLPQDRQIDCLKISENNDNVICSDSNGITVVSVVYNKGWKSRPVVLIFHQ